MTKQHPTGGSVVTQAFRPKSNPKHDGIDYRAAVGTPIKAADAGTVTVILHNDKRSGNYVQIQHISTPRVVTGYSHLSSIDVAKGDKVTAGQVIGKSGATGNVNGPHLHFGVKVGNAWVDPAAWLTSSSAPAPKPAAAPVKPAGGAVVLKWGLDNDARVKQLQRTLNAWYPGLTPLVVDGDYGDRTTVRVKYLQQRAGLKVDGVAGPKTLAVLGLKF